MKLPTLLLAALLAPAFCAIRREQASARRLKTKLPKPDTKYFHEPGSTDELSHYDIRYYKGAPVTYDERTDTLHHLIRAYLSVFRERNIETWIAHGTLLGWWWNGKILPWDWDLDVQVSAGTLTWLGTNLNMTTHNYTSSGSDGGEEVQRQYVLDVNPNIVDRVRGDGMNVIDARWIDVRNGLFIDITGLSENNPNTQPGVWSCKNFHRYRTRDLYPLRETVFEGVPALVPYAFDKILTGEYSPWALSRTVHAGHRWIPERKEWIPDPAAQKQLTAGKVKDDAAKPHVPRSLQADERPKAGLGNLWRVL